MSDCTINNKYKMRQLLARLERQDEARKAERKAFFSSPVGCISLGHKHPQTNNMGVEFRRNKNIEASGVTLPEVIFHVDYLRLTVWGDPSEFKQAYLVHLASALGSWVDMEHGGRYYQHVYQARLGARLYTSPGSTYADQTQTTLELPGMACQFLGFEVLRDFYIQLSVCMDRVSCSRLDLAFDQDLFSPKAAYEAFSAGNVRTLVKRVSKSGKSAVTWHENLFQTAEDGRLGCSTLEIGNRESTRFLRIYDKHGATRAELELKAEKSKQVAQDLFLMDEGRASLDEIYKRAMGHLRDYIDFTVEWWEAFVDGIGRALCKLSTVTASEIDAETVSNWIFKQVSAALSVFLDVYGVEYLEPVLQTGREKRKKNKKYQIILGVNDASI